MLYLYDNAIAADLQSAIDPHGGMNDHVKVMEPDGVIGLMAQLEEDKISFPLLCLIRSSDITIDANRSNFTRLHRGHAEIIDPKTNNLYLETANPIELKYAIHILATNTVDVDELTREIMFRYSSMYFITMKKPYEAEASFRFGVSIPPGSTITRESGANNYVKDGKLYESIIPIVCEGAVYFNYTPKHMTRTITQLKVES